MGDTKQQRESRSSQKMRKRTTTPVGECREMTFALQKTPLAGIDTRKRPGFFPPQETRKDNLRLRTKVMWIRKHPFVWGKTEFGRRSAFCVQWRKTSKIVRNRSSLSIGLGTWAFIPASMHRLTSSANAFAVIAMIGTVFASGRGRRRISLVA